MRSLHLAFLIVLLLPNGSMADPLPPDAWRYDANGDGRIGAEDLLYFMTLWGLQGIPTCTPTPTPALPTFTLTDTETPTSTETATGTSTVTEMATSTPIPTAESTFTLTVTSTETLTETGTATSTLIPTEESTFTPTVVQTDTETPTLTETPESTQTFTQSPTPLPTYEVVTISLPNLPSNARPLRLVRIPAGSFIMGNNGTTRDGNYSWELPRHEVTIGYDFYMGETEVTQAQWQAVMNNNPSSFGGRPDNPVEGVTWFDCESFIAAVNTLSGMSGFRFPSEAEWEYACRGSELNPNRYELFSFGDDLTLTNLNTCQFRGLFDQHMWWCGNADLATHTVASKLPNDYGLYDMHGNVWEWCQDWWHDNYNGAPTDGSTWDEGGTKFKVYRGGAWYNYAKGCRTSYRTNYLPAHGYNYLGLRLTRTP